MITSPTIFFSALLELAMISQSQPKKCVCASVAHVLLVTLRGHRFTREVYRKVMRIMRTDAIVN